MSVHAVFHNRDPEHLARGSAVYIASVDEDPGTPGLPCVPGNDPGFDSGKVGHKEFIPFTGNEGGPDQLGKHIRDIVIEHVQGIEFTRADKLPCLRKILHMVLREVLQLHDAPGEPSGPVCAIELEHPPAPSVRAGSVQHGLVFLH